MSDDAVEAVALHRKVTQAIALAIGTDVDLATAAIDAMRAHQAEQGIVEIKVGSVPEWFVAADNFERYYGMDDPDGVLYRNTYSPAESEEE